jgi:hypothetical protein
MSAALFGSPVRRTVFVDSGKVASALIKEAATLRCDNLAICSAVALRIHDERGLLKAIVVGHRQVYDSEFKQNLLQEMKKFTKPGNIVCVEAYHTAANPSLHIPGSSFGAKIYSSDGLEKDLHDVLFELKFQPNVIDAVMKQLREKQLVGPKSQTNPSCRTLIVHSNEDGTVSVEKPDQEGSTQVTWIAVAGIVAAAAMITCFFVLNKKTFKK